MKTFRPNRRALAGSAAMLVVAAAAAVVVGVTHSVSDTTPTPAPVAAAPAPVAAAPAPVVADSRPYMTAVSLSLSCRQSPLGLPGMQVIIDPLPTVGRHPDISVKIYQIPFTRAPNDTGATTLLKLAAPAHRAEATILVEQASTISIETADRSDRSTELPPQQDLSCPQWGDQGLPRPNLTR